ncbi:MAG: prepilin-type N-terminal cleavage/methylation domain-containing protein [Polyangiaceae bacterium]|nr:prepilin-type N-terminal cleavage/methylation domain-containing protein [Myxococcales bacterium]MCB9584285.1 prepilin-type N-terminal cleavage/methylation domain-containing protein [Polyangiaceae bacterium]
MKTHSLLASHELRNTDLTLLERLRLAAKLRRATRADQRGVTLFEVLIVVAILAMVAGGVAVFALPKYREAQVDTARTGARTIRTAVQQWQAANNETSCPTMSQLVQEKHIDSATNTDDPWGEAYILTCVDDEVYVGSKGPDKQKGTKDDIRIPGGGQTGGDEE